MLIFVQTILGKGQIKMGKVKDVKFQETDEFDLGPVLDDEGNELFDEDVIADAMRVETLTFSAGGKTYRIGVRKMDIPARLTNRLSVIQSQLAMKAGFRAGEDIKGGEEEDDADPRFSQFLLLVSESDELDDAWADISVAATVATNVPQFKPKPNRDQLLNDGVVGPGYIRAVRDFLTGGSADSEAATEPTTTPNGAAPSPPTAETSTAAATSPPTS